MAYKQRILVVILKYGARFFPSGSYPEIANERNKGLNLHEKATVSCFEESLDFNTFLTNRRVYYCRTRRSAFTPPKAEMEER